MDRPIAYVARYEAEYRRPILEKLNERLNGRLIVFAGSHQDSSLKHFTYEIKPKYQRVKLKNQWILGQTALIQNISPIIACSPSVILAEESPRTITLPFLLASAKKRKIGTLLWGHFSSNTRPFSINNLTDRYRISLAKKVDGCVCYTNEIAELIQPYISDRSCFIARNTLDTHRLFSLYDSLNMEGKTKVRIRLGIPPKAKTIVFIGRLISNKQPEHLLELHKALCEIDDATLVIIGDGPERAKLINRVNKENLNNIFFLGASKLNDSAPWIYAADVMVCPGYIGLNINHAFCLGLPVVTYRSPNPNIRYHSPEIAYLQPEMNGMMADYGNIDSLLESTLEVLKNNAYFSSNAVSYAKSHLSSDKMVDGLEKSINYVESLYD